MGLDTTLEGQELSVRTFKRTNPSHSWPRGGGAGPIDPMRSVVPRVNTLPAAHDYDDRGFLANGSVPDSPP